MPKRRTPKAIQGSEPIKERIEAFISAVDSQPESKTPAPDASRNFKAIRVPFNEYEFLQLEQACLATGRTKLNFIRYAILKVAKETQG